MLFLVTCRPALFFGDEFDKKGSFSNQYGITYVRGCEVKELLDEEGVQIKDYELEESARTGNLRTVR